MEVYIKDARLIWNNLKGLICVYKPADVKTEHVRKTIMYKICAELNEMKCRPPMEYISIEGNPLEKLTVKVEQNLADHPSVVGPRYQTEDFKCSWSNYLGRNTSGVLLFGLRQGTLSAKLIRENYPVRAYRVKGIFGEATDNCFKDGRVVEKSTFHHIKEPRLSRILATMQAAHQKKMFELCGVDIQSQTAYELAVNGPIRPTNSKIPLIYGIKCVHFDLPEFTIELQCVNEYELYLKMLIHDIGIQMHSTAHCTGIQCIRHSYFTLDNALLRKHWTLQDIFTNLQYCNNVLKEHKELMLQDSASLRNVS